MRIFSAQKIDKSRHDKGPYFSLPYLGPTCTGEDAAKGHRFPNATNKKKQKKGSRISKRDISEKENLEV